MSKSWKKRVSVSAKKVSAPIPKPIPILSADTITDTEFRSHTTQTLGSAWQWFTSIELFWFPFFLKIISWLNIFCKIIFSKLNCHFVKIFRADHFYFELGTLVLCSIVKLNCVPEQFCGYEVAGQISKFLKLSSPLRRKTQSCIKGLLGVRVFCFWAVKPAGPVLKKRLGANYEQLLRAYLFMFLGSKFFYFFLKNTNVSTIKSCLIHFLYLF